MRTCAQCGQRKLLSEFYRRASGQYRSYCNPCHHARNRVRRFGITVEEFESMAKAQGYRCLICRRRKRRLAIDHDHKTGKVRGLLCTPCNTALACVEENAARIVLYLKGEL
jgi:hypothetical protein